MKKNTFYLMITLLLLLLITGCVPGEPSIVEDSQPQLTTLHGESDHWNLHGYNIKIEGNTLFAGNGELQYKLDEDVKDNFSFKMVAQVGEQEVVLQEMKIVRALGDFNHQDTGQAEVDFPMNNEKAIILTDIDYYYAIVEWWSSQGEAMKEIIHI
ncbi:hypothetical protein ACIQ2D_15120 [Lysinibacillus sp. NPDC097287]|uniref:hypothetical protein n=1 Tax=Lysinibacillus sp. NPDC097287 TaxID=3364144 RepID=UPI0038178E67